MLMKMLHGTLIAVIATVTTPVLSEETSGDPELGKVIFKRCSACHMVRDESGNDLVKGGKIGPNLFKIVGRNAGSLEGFKYSNSLIELGETGYNWDEQGVADWVQNPSKFLKVSLDKPSAKSKMAFKLKDGGADVAAYLASLSK